MWRAVFLTLVLSVQIVFAQSQVCPPFVADAIDRLGEVCANVERNFACYGNNLVLSTFQEEVEPGFFSSESDVSPLVLVDTMETTALNAVDETWGVAVMKVQANVPGVIPGEAVTFVLMGDTTVENRVDPAEAVIPEPQTFTLTDDTLARSVPAWNANPLGRLNDGATVLGDATALDGAWLRVNMEDRPAWIASEFVAEQDVLAGLPEARLDAQSPMQSFYFTTAIGEPQCNDAPDVLAVRSPDNIKVNISINGLDVELGSYMTLKNVDEDQFTMTLHNGDLQIPDANIDVDPGQTLTALTDQERTVTGFLEVRDATVEEILIGQMAADLLSEAGAPVSDIVQTNENGEVIHIVVLGDTLYGIARQYDASAPAIVERNNLANPRNLIVGTRLVIPNPGSGFVPLPNTTPPTLVPVIPPAVSGQVDCVPFRLISPLDGLAYGQNTFIWEAAPGATAYSVHIVNLSNNNRLIVPVPGNQTSAAAIVDNESIGPGEAFQWYVEAVLNGQVVCTTGAINVNRGGVPDVPPVNPPVQPPDVQPPDVQPPTEPPIILPTSTPLPGNTPVPQPTNTPLPQPTNTPLPVPTRPPSALSASWGCLTSGIASIDYSGVPTGETVTFTFDKINVSGVSSVINAGPYPAPSGKFDISTGFEVRNGVATTSGGVSVPISPTTLRC